MKKLSIVLIGIAFIAAIFLLGPFTPTISHQALNCKRYKQTLTTLEKVVGEFHAGRISLDKAIVAGTSDAGVDGFFDGWGNKIISKNGTEGIFFSLGNVAVSGHQIALDRDESSFYCGNHIGKILDWFHF